MRCWLGCKPYEVSTKVPRVLSNIKEWKLHLCHHFRVIHHIQQVCHGYRIGWEGSDSSSDKSSSSTGSGTMSNDSSSLFSQKTESLLESEWGEESVGHEASGEEAGPLSVAHQESLERFLAGRPLDSRDLCQETRTPVIFFSYFLTMDTPFSLSLATFSLHVQPNRLYSPLPLVFVVVSSLT